MREKNKRERHFLLIARLIQHNSPARKEDISYHLHLVAYACCYGVGCNRLTSITPPGKESGFPVGSFF